MAAIKYSFYALLLDEWRYDSYTEQMFETAYLEIGRLTFACTFHAYVILVYIYMDVTW